MSQLVGGYQTSRTKFETGAKLNFRKKIEF